MGKADVVNTEEATSETFASVFPQPTHSVLGTVSPSAAPYRYELWNAQGQRVREGKGQGQENIPIAGLPGGV